MKRLAKLLKSVQRGAGEFSPSCREAARLQSKALDHALTARQQVGLRIHLWLCKWCRRYGQQISFLRSVGRRQDQEEHGLPPQKLRPEAAERIKRRLHAEKQ